MKVNDMQRLVRTENSMVRWMSGVTLKDRRPREELRRKLDIEGVEGVVRRGRLRWFGHVERKEADDWISKFRRREVHRTGLYGVGQLLLVTSNPCFSVDKLTYNDDDDDDDDDGVYSVDSQ